MTKTVYYDNQCMLCNYWVNFILKRSTKNEFQFIALQNDLAKKVLTDLQLSQLDFSTVIYSKGSKYFIKSDAAIEILHDLGGFWRISIMLKIVPTFIRDYFYSIISKNRHKLFAKTHTCEINSSNSSKKTIN